VTWAASFYLTGQEISSKADQTLQQVPSHHHVGGRRERVTPHALARKEFILRSASLSSSASSVKVYTQKLRIQHEQTYFHGKREPYSSRVGFKEE
jgi:hypothetical protein